MNRSFTLASIFLLVAPLVLAQSPGQPPSQDSGPRPPSEMLARPNGPDRGMRGPMDRGPWGDSTREERGPGGLVGMRVPPGTWWRNPEVVGGIGLSSDQVKKIDGIFLESRIQLIHMHASIEEEQLRLEPLLDANPVNEQAALAQISKIADTRADLEKANAKMLLAIRNVLTPDQWTKLQQPMGLQGPGGPGGSRGPDGHGGMPAPQPR